jgi:dTDP-4-dehydrorhamnose reductase
MIYISTDYVFDGSGDEPRLADDTDFGPLNVYGRSKLEGENAVRELLEKYFIVRTSWAFGLNGNNFIRSMIRAAGSGNEIRVVNDQIGTPTYTRDLARLLADMAESDRYGAYHATNEGGYISWYEFASEIFRICGTDAKVIPVTTEEYGLSKAKRPLNSRLDRSKLVKEGFEPLPDWRDALKRYLKEAGYID